MKVILDSRESDDNLIQLFTTYCELNDIELSISSLPFGDVACDNIIIERKTLNDLYSSIISPRLEYQLSKMKSNRDYISIFIIVGDKLYNDDLSKRTIINHGLFKIISSGVPYIKVFDDEDFIINCFKIFKTSVKIDSLIKKIKKNNKLSLFRALPTVGEQKSKKLIDAFGNFKNLSDAEKEDIEKIVGKSSADKIYSSIREGIN